MKFIISKEIKHALLIDEKNLRELFEFISNKYEKVEITIKCSDKSLLETKDIEEILSFENSNYRKIISITITGRNSLKEKLSLSIVNDISRNIVDVGNPFFGPTAEYTVISEEEEIAQFNSDKLKKLLLELKPSFFYDIFSRTTLLSIIVLFLGTASIIYFGGVFFGIISRTSPNVSGVESLINGVILFFALLVITYPFDLLRRWLLPRVFLLLGKQKKNMKTIENWRKNIFIVLALGILVSIIAGLILRKI